VNDEPADTRHDAYADRLVRLGGARWKQVLNVQAPYRWNLRRLDLHDTLDVGCGTGRNLVTLAAGSVGVDHNPKSVAVARGRGLDAVTIEEFHQRFVGGVGSFSSLLLAHVVEHMELDAARKLIDEYRPYLRPQATLALICPQEAGFRSDSTHVTFFDLDLMRGLCDAVGATVLRRYSFPFPRPAGRLFRYNEFVVLARFTG
jgi:SAM-dependent methyltransferase